MDELHTTTDIIVKMLSLFSITRNYSDDMWAIFINTSIYQGLVKLLKHESLSWDHTLRIGEKEFEMKLIVIQMSTIDLNELIQKSQFTMPWLEHLTLFSDLKTYYKLEKFIEENNLGQHIVSIVDEEGPTIKSETIRVVTFSDQVDKIALIKEYRYTVILNEIHYFFITLAFPWLQPQELQPTRIPWMDHHKLHSTLPLVLHQLSLMCYTNDLDIFDLISLKLAVCDYPAVANHLSSEIDYFIARSLRQMISKQTYLNDKLFDVTRYLYERNFTSSYFIIKCFLYEFQDYVDTIRCTENFNSVCASEERSYMPLNTNIVLTEETDAVKILSSKSKARFTIDGSNFIDMTFRLFCELLAYDNVKEIILDTDFPWIDIEPVQSKSIDFSQTRVTFVGTNSAYFIENFVSSLKTMSYDSLDLTITQPLGRYTEFDNFVCNTLEFNRIYIVTKLLDDLNQCNLSRIKTVNFYQCTFENKEENWELYYRTKQITELIIEEDECTWQCLFNFIANQLNNSIEGEFKFNMENLIYIQSEIMYVGLNELTFRYDELNTKLEILNGEMRIIDLFELKHGIDSEDDKCSFDFYQ